MKYLKEYYAQKPLQCILLAAFLLRLIAAIFAKGYGMHDDHFIIIENAGAFADGKDAGNWLPTTPGNTGPQGHSFFYMGLHYVLFAFLKMLGIASPEIKMYIVRIIHAIYSLSIVYFGYKIAEKYSTPKIASIVAWLLAAFWFMPWASVRNLVEFQCIPFLLWGTWIFLKKDTPDLKSVIFSGLISGIAFSIRFQAMFFLFGFGLALLCIKQFKNAAAWGISVLFMMFLIQGGIDFFIWGKPCVEFIEYVRYNIDSAGDYLTGSVFKYIFVILGLLIPPVSIFIFFGFFARWRKYLILFLPAFCFLLFHSLFENKQERFIFTIVPSVIILGIIGWSEFTSIYSKQWLKSFLKGSWVFFIIINTLLLCVVSVHYSKKARVETMTYLSKYDNIKQLATMSDVPMLPMFYLGYWIPSFDIDKTQIYNSITVLKQQTENEPDFVIMVDNNDLNKNVDSLKAHFPGLRLETKIAPNFVDALLFKINPKNRNETLVIYRNQKTCEN